MPVLNSFDPFQNMDHLNWMLISTWIEGRIVAEQTGAFINQIPIFVKNVNNLALDLYEVSKVTICRRTWFPRLQVLLILLKLQNISFSNVLFYQTKKYLQEL